ncbi:MAG: histidine kinase [Saprospiraceae bacterium]
MKLRIHILLVFLIAFSVSVFGQKEKYSKSNRVQSNTELLEEARAIQKERPAEAIELVEEVLRNFNKKKKRKRRAEFSTEAKAYTLLGEIYVNINQNKLALQRYQQAAEIWRNSKGNDEPASELYYRIGQLYLKEKDAKNAEGYFLRCAKTTDDKSLKQLCQEGLADVELLRGNVEKSFSQLDQIESDYELDSLAQSRVLAKRSQGYNQQNDYSNAVKNLEESVNNLPKNQKLETKDIESVQIAKDDIQSNSQNSNQQKIVASSKSTYGNVIAGTIENKTKFKDNASSKKKEQISVPSDLQIRENLQLASLYEEEKNLIEAEKFIKISKDVIDKNTAAASVADVYKKSAELNRKKGKLDEALLDLEKYTTAKEEAITDLENKLKEQIEVVKGQQQIDLVRKDFDIEEKESELLGSQLKTQKVISGFLGLLLLASLVFFYYLNKNVKEKRKANQMLLVKSLRTQMNPHFIFNALNSVNNFIAKNDEKAANKFLSEFSRLMRKVLDYSQRDFISFEEEIELNELYLKLEHFRFRDKFEYTFEKNTEVNTYDLEVPPMLIQPFIENAVWHGLRYKEGRGQLKISINDLGNVLLVKIQDDGIGRKKSAELKTANQKKYKSTGLQNVSKRIALINEIYGKNYKIEVSDFDETKEDAGTLVQIRIPK